MEYIFQVQRENHLYFQSVYYVLTLSSATMQVHTGFSDHPHIMRKGFELNNIIQHYFDYRFR